MTPERKKKIEVVLDKRQPTLHVVLENVDDERGWETMIDFTKIKKGGVPAEDVLKALKAFSRNCS